MQQFNGISSYFFSYTSVPNNFDRRRSHPLYSVPFLSPCMVKKAGETHNTHFAAIKPFFVGSAKKMPPSSLEAEYHYTRAEQKKTSNFPHTKKLEINKSILPLLLF